MKKFVAILALCIVMVAVLAACNPTTCDLCGAKDVDTTAVEVDGEESYLCDECAEDIEELKEAADEVKDAAGDVQDALDGLTK